MRLAEVLRVDIEEFTGAGDQDETGRRAYPAASLIEQAMMGYGTSGPPGQDAILQPPKPEIAPSARILQLAAEHDIEPEAGG